ncbi:MAG: vanadium-dependent haloperoxidase [Segetibacter sp.]
MKLQSMLNRQKVACLLLISLFIFLFSCKKTDKRPEVTNESADVAHDWYKLLIRIQLHQNPAPFALLNMSNFGYIGVGLYESVQPGIKGSVSLSTKLYQMPGMPAAEVKEDYLWAASANAALASMSRLLLAGLTEASKVSIDSLERAYNQRFASGTSEAVLTRSQTFGRSIATAVHDWSKTDNMNISNTDYVWPVFPGAWEPTPPVFAKPAGPYIGEARPFLESSLTATAPPFPFPYSEDESSEFYKMVKEVYDISITLTPEQKTIARFWADVGGPGNGYAVPGHFISIVTQVLEKKGFDLGRAAELYAKTSIATRDALINMWRFKYKYNIIRPVTYINRFIDPAWQTLVPTPPYPEYPSALTYILGSAMQVLTRELGDNIPVTDNTYIWNGSTARQYTSFTKVTEEGAISRVYAGIHYKIVVEMSLPLAKQIGDKVADIKLVK